MKFQIYKGPQKALTIFKDLFYLLYSYNFWFKYKMG